MSLQRVKTVALVTNWKIIGTGWKLLYKVQPVRQHV